MMNPDLLAHLCRFLGYLEGKDYLDLEEFTQPIQKIIDDEIAAFNTPIPMSDEPMMEADKLECCGHFGQAIPENCRCDDDCPCKRDTCQPVPLEQLPLGINAKGDGTASGMNLSNQTDEEYYHCVPCGGWHKGDPIRQREADGVALLCLYCSNIVARAETRNENPS